MKFQLIENDPEYPDDGATCWYWDTERPLPNDAQPFVAVQCYCAKDPNEFVRVEHLRLLFTDQQEYYAVCADCYESYRDMQWSGSTQGHNWRNHSARFLKNHQGGKGWCEFCDPVFGIGGWIR